MLPQVTTYIKRKTWISDIGKEEEAANSGESLRRLRCHNEEDEILGVLSLVLLFFALIALCKYVIFVLGVDDSGEDALPLHLYTNTYYMNCLYDLLSESHFSAGGTFALYSFLSRQMKLGLLGDSFVPNDHSSVDHSESTPTENKASSILKDFFDKSINTLILEGKDMSSLYYSLRYIQHLGFPHLPYLSPSSFLTIYLTIILYLLQFKLPLQLTLRLLVALPKLRRVHCSYTKTTQVYIQLGNLDRRHVLKDFSRMLDDQIEKIVLFMLQQQGILARRISDLGEQQEKLQQQPDNSQITRLREAYRAAGQDLLKLLYFVEINAIGLRKILKKFDERLGYSFTDYYIKTRANHPYSQLQQVFKHVSCTLSSSIHYGGQDIYIILDVFMHESTHAIACILTCGKLSKESGSRGVELSGNHAEILILSLELMCRFAGRNFPDTSRLS
ncbi:hypothetical protein ACFE04_009728 [Oxalis oulophora]